PPADAALYLPALGGRRHRARGPETRLGPRQQIARLPDAAGRHSADPASDRSVDVRATSDSFTLPWRGRVGRPLPSGRSDFLQNKPSSSARRSWACDALLVLHHFHPTPTAPNDATHRRARSTLP